jgi:hypothetical protein
MRLSELAHADAVFARNTESEMYRSTLAACEGRRSFLDGRYGKANLVRPKEALSSAKRTLLLPPFGLDLRMTDGEL